MGDAGITDESGLSTLDDEPGADEGGVPGGPADLVALVDDALLRAGVLEGPVKAVGIELLDVVEGGVVPGEVQDALHGGAHRLAAVEYVDGVARLVGGGLELHAVGHHGRGPCSSRHDRKSTRLHSTHT